MALQIISVLNATSTDNYRNVSAFDLEQLYNQQNQIKFMVVYIFYLWSKENYIVSYQDIHFLVHLSRRLKCTIVIMHCPSSVRPSSIVRPSIVNYSHFRIQRNSMKLHRKQDLNFLYQVCVLRADRKNKMAALASDWLRHFRLLLCNRWTEFNETRQKARY